MNPESDNETRSQWFGGIILTLAGIFFVAAAFAVWTPWFRYEPASWLRLILLLTGAGLALSVTFIRSRFRVTNRIYLISVFAVMIVGGGLVRLFEPPINWQLDNAADRGDVWNVRWLLIRGADPGMSHSGYNPTPLMRACWNGDTELVRFLIAHGAYPDYREKDGFTSMVYAAQDGHWDLVEILHRSGADHTLTGADGISVIEHARIAGREEIIQLLTGDESMTAFEPDVKKRIEGDYRQRDWDDVYQLVASVPRGARTQRAALHLSQGRLPDLQKFANAAIEDYRNVLWWSEDNGLDPRDFRRPFEESEEPLDDEAMRKELDLRLEQAKPLLDLLNPSDVTQPIRLSDDQVTEFDEALANLADVYWTARDEPCRLIREQFDRPDVNQLWDVTWQLHPAMRRFAFRMKTEDDVHWLRRGLAVGLMENARHDERDLIVSLVILRAGAERAGIESRPWFDRAIARATEDSVDSFRNARDHEPGDIEYTLEQYGPPDGNDSDTSQQ